MTEETANWPTEWLRGVLEVCTLTVLAEGAAHGYAVAQRLQHGGLGTVKGGTLYPLLTRLESAGLLEAEWQPGEGGPGRKVFTLTAQGHAERRRRAEEWERFTAVIGSLTGVDVPRSTR